MPDDLTLPGDLPGLLRRSSPVLAPVSTKIRTIGRRALVEGEHLDSGLVLLADGALEAARDLRLDLTTPTGRVHAAWWASSRVVGDLSPSHAGLLWKALAGADMDDTDIITLRDICLRLGGRVI